MITSADVPAPKPEPNHRPLPVFSSQAGLASFTTDREICDHGSYYVNDDGARVCLVCGHVTDREDGGRDD